MKKKNKMILKINWQGPFRLGTVINKMKDAGEKPYYEGNDYGLYQIYGNHILCLAGTLLYIGEAIDQVFSVRFKQHDNDWLGKEKGIRIYLGRIYNPEKHSRKDKWDTWKRDVNMAERIMIYKYSPNYNNVGITEPPKLSYPVRLIHYGKRHKLKKEDNVPADFKL